MYHVPILAQQIVDFLVTDTKGVYVDGTLGGAGHTTLIANRLQGGRLISIDRDSDAIEHARALNLQNVQLVRANFCDIEQILHEQGIQNIDGALLDLGVSSHQINLASRGFSYMQDSKLDMRMDKNQSKSAFDVVNTYSEQQLSKIFFAYGEEKFAKKIAAAIVASRARAQICTTFELNQIIKDCVGFYKGGHPSKKVFQAIRIEVNGELEILEGALSAFVSRLKSGGRMAVLTFHSLEDRITKQVFKQLSLGCICSKEIPICVCNHQPTIRTYSLITPSEQEIKQNSRAKSAKLRLIEKL